MVWLHTVKVQPSGPDRFRSESATINKHVIRMLCTDQFEQKMTGNKTISLGVMAQVPQLSSTLSVSKTGRIIDLAPQRTERLAMAA